MKNTLAFSCPHIPFEDDRYLNFLKRIHKAFKCTRVVCLGDMVDNHSISYHEHDPQSWAPANEMKEADKHLVKWFKAFPKLYYTFGNHCNLVDRKGKTVGLPRRCFRQFREMWKFPNGWVTDFEFEFDGVLYKHGTGYSGKYGHINAAVDARQNCVIGHLHSILAVDYLANSKQLIFGVGCGCGIDLKSYAFSYGKGFRRKPILGAAIISATNHGVNAQVIPMEMGER